MPHSQYFRSLWSEIVREGRVTTYLLRRLGLAVITLWLLSVIVFFAGQVLPGDPGRAILGPLAAQSSVRVARPPARRGPAPPHAVPQLDWRAAARQHGHVLHVPDGSRAVHLCRACQLGQTRRAGLHHRRAARHHRRSLRSAQVRPGSRPGHLGHRSLLRDGARVRIGNRAHRDLRRRAEVVPGLGFGRSWRVPGGAALSPDPARDPARARAFRLHRPDGQGRHHRIARI